MIGPDTFHLMPISDLRDHDHSISCWCHPSRDDDEPSIIIHNSMDQRELVEEGKRAVQ